MCPHHSPSLKEVRNWRKDKAGTLKQKLKQRLWKDASYKLSLHGLLRFSYITQDYQPSDDTFINRLGTSSPNTCLKKMPYSLSCSLILWKDFFDRYFISQMTVACVKLTWNKIAHTMYLTLFSILLYIVSLWRPFLGVMITIPWSK